MLVAPPFYWSIKTANWPVLLVAAAVTPRAGWLGALKPNLGLVVLAYRPERATFIGGLVLLVGSLLASPAWPAEWLTHVKAQPVDHLSAIFWPAGAIGLLGILRWRTPEGRSLLALSLTPTASLPYDWLMLWLVCRTGREFVALTVASWFTWLAVLATAPHDLTRAWTAGHFILAVGWLGTAAAIVLRRRNAPPKLQQVNRPT
jgi:hypothetical protein